jgi:hypothetical protein
MVVEPMNRFKRAFFNFEEDSGLPTISFSAVNFPEEDRQQGNILRHQTEHYIDLRNKPNASRNRKILIGASATAGALIGLKIGFDIVPHLDLRSLSGVHGLETDWMDSSLALSGAVGALVGELGMIHLSPSELRAEKAQVKQRDHLPDGVLRLELNNRPRRLL